MSNKHKKHGTRRFYSLSVVMWDLTSSEKLKYKAFINYCLLCLHNVSDVMFSLDQVDALKVVIMITFGFIDRNGVFGIR